MSNNSSHLKQSLRQGLPGLCWLLLGISTVFAAEAADLPATFVGSSACASCHQEQTSKWLGSHHQLAMQTATAETVLGDFKNRTFNYFGSETRFFRRDGEFLVRTENASGTLEDFKVTHTFGIKPLQQYLVQGERGRKQALTIVWDTRPASIGGQRWYHLYPDEQIKHDDPLHWTRPYFTWNTMCAECHSTNLATGYDLASDTFKTSFSEVSVGCEACHGPGSNHISFARRGSFPQDSGFPVDLDDRSTNRWVMNSKTGIAERTNPGTQQQVEACGRCHARRTPVAPEYEYGQPLTQTHRPVLLEENLYHPDGRISDEVYVYGSFLQSRMYQAGVTCSDCHDAHSGQLNTGPRPNDTCNQCHLPQKYASAQHSANQVGDCVACHMPSTTYMGVDERADHSFRIPGTWADTAHYGQAIAAGRQGNANRTLLVAAANKTYPAIARATLFSLVSPPVSALGLQQLELGLGDPDPLVRIGALRAISGLPPERVPGGGAKLLHDPVRSVRIEAAQVYLYAPDRLAPEFRPAFAGAIDEYRQSLLLAAAMPEGALRLAELASNLNNINEAEQFYLHTLKLDPAYAMGQHGYGLFLVRERKYQQALAHLEQAVELDPSIPQFVYIYGVALNSLDQTTAAINVLRSANAQFPQEARIGFTLATILRDTGQRDEALRVARQLLLHYPGHPTVRALVKELE